MNDALAVRRIHGVGHREGEIDERRGGHGAARQSLLQRLAFEQFHRDERRIAADVVDGADVGMVERRGGTRFPLKAFQDLRRLRDPVRQHFDGDHALETGIPRPIHVAHPASADQRDDFVRPQAGFQRKAS